MLSNNFKLALLSLGASAAVVNAQSVCPRTKTDVAYSTFFYPGTTVTSTATGVTTYEPTVWVTVYPTTTQAANIEARETPCTSTVTTTSTSLLASADPSKTATVTAWTSTETGTDTVTSTTTVSYYTY